MDSRSNRRQKKKPIEIWVKVLVIIALFFVAGIGGYLVGGLPQVGNKKSSDDQQTLASHKEKTKEMQLNQPIQLSTGVSIRFIQLRTEPQVQGPNCPVGIVAEVTNNAKKKMELPYKYLINLSVNQKQVSSVGIYSFDSIQMGTNPTAYTAKLMPGETAKVVYLFSMSNKNEWQTAKKGTIKMRDNGSEYKMTVPLIHNGEEANYIESQSSDNNQLTTSSTISEENNRTETSTSLSENQQPLDANAVTPQNNQSDQNESIANQ